MEKYAKREKRGSPVPRHAADAGWVVRYLVPVLDNIYSKLSNQIWSISTIVYK